MTNNEPINMTATNARRAAQIAALRNAPAPIMPAVIGPSPGDPMITREWSWRIGPLTLTWTRTRPLR